MEPKMNDWKIPFTEGGDQISYPDHNSVMVDNFAFDDTLTYETFERGRSAARMVFTTSSGKRVRVFLKEFEDMVPFMLSGKISGRFTFCKRGQNFGCKLIKGAGA